MARPSSIPVIDTLIGFRDLHQVGSVPGARGDWKHHPAEYMFRHVPEELASAGDRLDAVAETVAKMDVFGIRYGMIHLSDDRAPEALDRHPDRFVAAQPIDANGRMEAVRLIERAVRERGARAVTIFASGLMPQVPLNDRLWYPVYAKCVELDVPVFANVGVPGPRVPMMAQYVGHLDEVCYDFPELKIVMRHGGEPWVDLAVKLLLKWPNLHYSTSGFAPKYWPEPIVSFANTRGADEILYGGYFPAGLELERIFAEMDGPFREHVWPKFLYANAAGLLGLPALDAA